MCHLLTIPWVGLFLILLTYFFLCGLIVFAPCFVMLFLVTFLVLQPSCWKESGLLYFNCIVAVCSMCRLLTIPWVGLVMVLLTYFLFYVGLVCLILVL